MATDLPKIFISHSSSDEKLAEHLVDLLLAALPIRGSEIRCTSVEGHGLEGGANFAEQLRTEIVNCPSFIALISKKSVQSEYVNFELGARWGAKKQLIPLLAPNCTLRSLKGPLANTHALRWGSSTDLQKLISQVARTLSVDPVEPSEYDRHIKKIEAMARRRTRKQRRKR
jgi:hypothetical protein